MSPKTMWITTKSDTTNETDTSVLKENENLGKSKNERSVCKATKVESVQVISLIKANTKTDGNIDSEAYPIEVKLAKSLPAAIDTNEKKSLSIKQKENNKTNLNIESEADPVEVKQATVADTDNKKSPSIETCQKHIEPDQEPIELEKIVSQPGVLEPNKIEGSSTKSDEKDLETVTSKTEIVTTKTEETLTKNEATCVGQSARERLIPIEIPRIISWAELGVEPLQLKKIKIGPLTETNKWSEKRASDEKLENFFQDTETQNKVVDLTEFFLNRNEENAEKVRNSSILCVKQEHKSLVLITKGMTENQEIIKLGKFMRAKAVGQSIGQYDANKRNLIHCQWHRHTTLNIVK